MESQLVVWASKAIFKWPVTAVINYNCELLLRKVAKLCSMSLPPFMPVMEALMRELACGRRTPARRLHPWGRKAPRRGTCRFTPVCSPAKPHGQRSLAGYSPRGLREWDTTGLAHAHTHTYTHARAHAHTPPHTHRHTDTHIHRHKHTHTQTHTHTYTHTHTPHTHTPHTHSLTHTQTHTHTDTPTHTHTHTHTPPDDGKAPLQARCTALTANISESGSCTAAAPGDHWQNTTSPSPPQRIT